MSDPGSQPPPPPPDLAPPPGYVGYTGGSPARAGTILRLRTFVLVGLALTVVVVIIQMATTPGLIDSSRDFLAGRIDEATYEDELNPGTASAVTQLPFIATVVLSMTWLFHVVRSNIEAGRRGTWGPGWAIGGWFLPPLVLYIIPMLVLRESWRASDPDLTLGDDRWKRGAVHPVLWIWWALYGLAPAAFIVLSAAGLVSNQFTGFGGDTSDVAQAIVDNQGLGYAQNVVTLLAAAAWGALVWLWTARQRRFLGA